MNNQALNKMHRAYTLCLKSKYEAWAKEDWEPKAPVAGEEPVEVKAPSEEEWCANEKYEYLRSMEKHTPVLFENVMRSEDNNF